MKTALRNVPLVAALALLVGVVLLACAPTAAPPSAARPTEWNVVLSEQTGGGDSFTEYGTNASYSLLPYVVEPLMRLELLPDGKSWGVVNVLAEKWSFPDSKTLVVELKKGVHYHNGEELTSEHVKYAFDSIVLAEKPTRRAATLKALGQAEVVDKYTVRWRMPVANISVLGTIDLMQIPALARRSTSAEEFERKPIGTGPYRAIEWQRDGTVRLEAWDGYHGAKAFPQKLVVRYVPEPSTRVMELQAGTAQIAQGVPIESVSTIQADPKLEVASLKGNSGLSYVINLFKTTPPFRDKRIRQAMNYAVDREPVVKSILGGRGAVMPGPLWSGWLGQTDDVKSYPYDPEKAKALLKEAGYPDGFSFTWTVTQGVYPKDIEIAQAVASQMAKVGIKATIQPLERSRLLAQRSEGDYDVTELVWPMRWYPVSMFTNTLETSFPDAKLAPNWGTPPPELVEARRLVQAAGAATTTEQTASGYAQANRLMHDEAFWLFIHSMDDLWGVQKDIAWRPYPGTYPQHYDYWGLLGKKAPSDPTIPLVLE
ncbi:MAG: ABC transporter substrate-binding protein [Chloroflexi bacterium]|nr:ABC transporter substrate-binding protein [Chloroflexota bacterium]